MLSPLPLVIPAQAGLVNCIARRGLRSDAAIQFNNSIRLTNSGRLYGRLLMLPTGLPRRFKQSPRNDEEGELSYLLLSSPLSFVIPAKAGNQQWGKWNYYAWIAVLV